jgi:hypothetical protein
MSSEYGLEVNFDAFEDSNMNRYNESGSLETPAEND